MNNNLKVTRKAIVFVDANNWYHNLKHYLTPSDIDIIKLKELISKENDLESLDWRRVENYVKMITRKKLSVRQRNAFEK